MQDSDPPEERRTSEASDLGRYAGLGFQFAATMLVFGALGWWLDGKFGSAPWVMIFGIFLGAGLAFFSLLRAVNPPRAPTSDAKQRRR